MSWKRRKNAVPEEKEDLGKTAENLMIHIIQDPNAEYVRTEDPAKTEENTKKPLD